MKIGISNWARPFASAWRVLAFTLVVCATGGAWAAAPTPTVMWDGDFSSRTKTVGGVTYSINNIGNGNSLAADNSYLQVANSDNGYATPTITATGGDAPFGSTDGTTVIAFYREMPISQGSNRAVLSLLSADTYKNGHVHLGVYRDGPTGNTAAGFIVSGQGSGTKTKNVFSGGEQMVAFSYKSDTGMMSYYVNGRKIASANSGVAAFTPTGVCLGGVDYTSSGTFFAMKGMKVLGVAIFNRELTAEEVAEFSFAKWDTSNKWRFNDTLAYREPTSGTASDFAYATVAMVGVDGVADTSTFSLNSPYHHPYTVLNEPSGNYAFPGAALVFDKAGYKAPPAPNFGDMILGGLHVTANRAENTPYGLTSGTGGTRNTALGDKSGYRETYFVFDESFYISRQGSSGTGNSKLYGVVNIEVASDKEFSLNGKGETGNGATIVMTTAGTTAPVLRMVGGGKFKVGTLDASSGTLDFSGVTSAPFIQGGLTVTASTKLILPAGTAEDTPYVLNSTGTLTAPAVVQGATVQIGSGAEEEVILLYDTENRSVKYYRSFPEYNGTVSGSTITWDTEPTAEQMEVGIVNLTGSGEVTLSTEPFALDVGSGVTVDVTGYSSAALSGAGTFKYTSGYPTTVPTGLIYQYVGSNDSANPTTIDGVTVDGTLKTSGYVNLTSLVIDAAGTFDVLSESSTVSTTTRSNGAGNLSGTIVIRSGATMVNATTDGLDWGGTTRVDIYGTLSMRSTRWSIREFDNCQINLYPSAQVTGAGDGNGVFDLFNASSKLNMYAGTSGGTATISGPVRLRTANTKYPIWIASGATLELSGGTLGNGGFSMNGAGELKLSGTMGHSGASLVQDGTVTLDNITTAIPITVNSGKTLAVIATEAATTVPVNVTTSSDNVTFSGAGKVNGTITKTSAPGGNLATALQSSAWTGTFVADWAGANRTQFDINSYGNAYSVVEVTKLAAGYVSGSNANVTVVPTVNVSGTMTLDNGYSGKTTTFTKLTGSGTVTFNNYTCNITTLDNFTGTLKPTDSYGTSIGTINLTSTPAFGAKVVTLGTGANIRSIGTTSVSVNNVADSTIKLAVVANDGIYRAEAAYGGANYKTLAAAVSAAEAASADPSAVTVYNSSATVPSGYALVTAAGGAMTLRSAGSGELIYWASSNSGDWSGEASNGTHTFYSTEGGTSTTPYVTGDTVVFTSDTQIWSKTAAHGAKFQIGTDTAQAEVHFTRSGDNCNDYILDGSTIEIKSGSKLVAERYGLSGSTYTGWDSYNSHDGSEINDTTITGAGTFKVGGDTGSHGAAAAILSGATTITCPIALETEATLVVPTSCSVTTPTAVAAKKAISVVTDDETFARTYSVVDAAAAVVNGENVVNYATVQAAVNAVAYPGTIYNYVLAYQSASVTPASLTLKIKEDEDVTVTVTCPYGDYQVSESEPVDGVVTYTLIEKATTYTWVGSSGAVWGGYNFNCWQYDNSGVLSTANRLPDSADTVVFNGDATVTLSDSTTVGGVEVGDGVVALTGSSKTLTATSGGIVLTDSDATLAVTGVTLSPEPTTNVSHSRVKAVTVDGTTTYSVEEIPGTIFSVW